MITNKIDNLDDLRKEKQRLKLVLAEHEVLLKAHIEELGDSLKPAQVAIDLVKKITGSPKDGLVNNGIRSAVGIASNMLFSGYSWPVRTALSFVSKNLVGNLVHDKGPGLLNKALTWWQQRQKTKKEIIKLEPVQQNIPEKVEFY